MEKSDIDVVAGNVYDKYNTRNPMYRWLVSRYFASLTDLLGETHPKRVLEVGCGEGHMTEFARKKLPQAGFTALDISNSIVSGAARDYQAIRFVCGNAYRLPFDENQFDLVLALESLEHMTNAEHALSEIRRVGSQDVIVSVPQEPIWRVLNFVRGAYQSEWGNTPGHVRHWSTRGIVHLLGQELRVERVLAPFPWTMAICSVA
jgi:ubiquinone/menaquinone biosynthesis C-methylase UbiE